MLLKKAYDFVEALLDLPFAGILLVVLKPVVFAEAVFVAATLGRPIIFAQRRAGQHEKIFTLSKFRSMREGGGEADLADNASRHVPAGKLLRSLSPDKPPHLWNLLNGDTSFIGPRPLLVEYLSLYSPEQARRMEVKPGITGLAQVEGRNSLSWSEKFRLDLSYVETRSFRLDALILAKSVVVVASKNGVNASGQQTNPYFSGMDSAP